MRNNPPPGWKQHLYKEKFINPNSTKVWFGSLCGLVSSGEKTAQKDKKYVNCRRCLNKLEKK